MKKKITQSSAFITLLAILIGLVAGALLLLAIGNDPGVAYSKLISGIFSKPKFITYSIVYAAPLVFTGLSVAFSFKTGVFNIGAEGQFVVGGLAATIVGVCVSLPPVIHAAVCILAAAAAGALWGAIVGFLKIKKGINEVLSYIMFNWIAFYFSNYMVNRSWLHAESGGEATRNVAETARILCPQWIKTLTGCTDANWGIVLAIVAAIVVWFVMSKTTFGYQLRAVGFSRTAAEYAGINSNRVFLSSMSISGALAGIGGAVQILGLAGRLSQFAAQEGFGFQGITVALIGANNPIGCIFSGLFYGAFKYGGNKLTMVNVPTEVVNIIMGVIVLVIALSPVIRKQLAKMFLKREEG